MAEHDGATHTARKGRTAIVAALAGLIGIGVARYKRNRRRLAGDVFRSISEQRHASSAPDHDERPGHPSPAGLAAAEDPAHAPGHRHLPPPPKTDRPRSTPRWRPRADRIGHPGRFG